MICLSPVESWSNIESVVFMQSSAQEVTMLFKLIAAAKDSWACFGLILLSLIATWVHETMFSLEKVSKKNSGIFH